jgi:PhnB protein
MADEDQAPTTGLTPYITVREGRGSEAVAFYQRAFGAREVQRHLADDGKRLMHSHLIVNGASLMLSDDFPEYRGGTPAPEPGGTTLHLQVTNADEWWNRAVEAGAQIRMPLADQFWGDRYGQLRDPFGHSWSIGAPVAKVETQMAPA